MANEGATTKISKNAQVLKFFAQQDRGIPRKRLVKMVYETDIIARQYLGEPVSTFEWRLFQYGPYSREIPSAVDELVACKLAWTQETEATEDGPGWKRLFDSGQPIVFDFKLEENEVLAYVSANYLNMPMDELLFDVVYETKPMKAAKHLHERLPMEIVDNEGRNLVGFDLGRIIKAETQVRAGNFLTAAQFFDGLRNRIAARYAE
jgi:uncharacterized protein YwgA